MLVPTTRVASSSSTVVVVVVPIRGGAVLLGPMIRTCCRPAMVSQAESRSWRVKGGPGRVEGSAASASVPEEGGVVVRGGQRLLLLPIAVAVAVVVVRVLRLAVVRGPRSHDGRVRTASERTGTRSDGQAGADSHSVPGAHVLYSESFFGPESEES